MKVIISRDAEEDLKRIGDYIAQDNIEAASKFVERLKGRCVDLGQFPKAGKRQDELKEGWRSVTEGDYIIFYRVRADVVEIMRIMHGRRDIPRTL